MEKWAMFNRKLGNYQGVSFHRIQVPVLECTWEINQPWRSVYWWIWMGYHPLTKAESIGLISLQPISREPQQTSQKRKTMSWLREILENYHAMKYLDWGGPLLCSLRWFGLLELMGVGPYCGGVFSNPFFSKRKGGQKNIALVGPGVQSLLVAFVKPSSYYRCCILLTQSYWIFKMPMSPNH